MVGSPNTASPGGGASVAIVAALAQNREVTTGTLVEAGV